MQSKYKFKWEKRGDRMVVSTYNTSTGETIASASYASSGPSNPTELQAAYRYVRHATANHFGFPPPPPIYEFITKRWIG